MVPLQRREPVLQLDSGVHEPNSARDIDAVEGLDALDESVNVLLRHRLRRQVGRLEGRLPARKETLHTDPTVRELGDDCSYVHGHWHTRALGPTGQLMQGYDGVPGVAQLLGVEAEVVKVVPPLPDKPSKPIVAVVLGVVGPLRNRVQDRVVGEVAKGGVHSSRRIGAIGPPHDLHVLLDMARAVSRQMIAFHAKRYLCVSRTVSRTARIERNSARLSAPFRA